MFFTFITNAAYSVTGLEDRLAVMSGRKHCVFTASGSVALVLALQLLREQRGAGNVIVPAITCPAVAQAVVYAGHQPIFADVARADCTVDIDSVASLLTEDTRAIIPIHIYGHGAPIGAVCKLAAAPDVPVIEDAAQAIGGAIDGRPIGSFGAFSILSFSATKIIDAGAGGALLLDDPAIANRARELLDQFPMVPATRLGMLELSQRNLYHALADALRTEPDTTVSTAFRSMLPAYRDIYLRRLCVEEPIIDRIESGLDALEANLSHRRAIAAIYSGGLAPFSEQVERPQEAHATGAPWRYTLIFREPDTAIEVTRALRNRSLPASNHYWSVARLMNDQPLRQADIISRRVLNLWLSSSVNLSAAEETVGLISQILLQSA